MFYDKIWYTVLHLIFKKASSYGSQKSLSFYILLRRLTFKKVWTDKNFFILIKSASQRSPAAISLIISLFSFLSCFFFFNTVFSQTMLFIFSMVVFLKLFNSLTYSQAYLMPLTPKHSIYRSYNPLFMRSFDFFQSNFSSFYSSFFFIWYFISSFFILSKMC